LHHALSSEDNPIGSSENPYDIAFQMIKYFGLNKTPNNQIKRHIMHNPNSLPLEKRYNKNRNNLNNEGNNSNNSLNDLYDVLQNNENCFNPIIKNVNYSNQNIDEIKLKIPITDTESFKKTKE